jgi:two-component system, NarL family, response regulator NreC
VISPAIGEGKITILVADDHGVVREGVVSLLAREADLAVVAEAANGQEAVRLAAALQPEVAVLDVSMPRLNGLTAASQILRASPEVQVIMLTVHSDEAYVAQALTVGVRGYVLKQALAADLVQAIRTVRQGRTFLSPQLANAPGQCGQTRCVETDGAVDDLTLREVEVLQLIAEGYGNKDIAQALSVSVKTVETHRGRLMSKLDIHETAGLVRFAIRKKIVEP